MFCFPLGGLGEENDPSFVFHLSILFVQLSLLLPFSFLTQCLSCILKSSMDLAPLELQDCGISSINADKNMKCRFLPVLQFHCATCLLFYLN